MFVRERVHDRDQLRLIRRGNHDEPGIGRTRWFGELRAEFAAPSQPANRASGNGDNNGKHGNQGRIHGLSDPKEQQWGH